MEAKKISFGFMKTKKSEKPAAVEEKREYIECVEEKSIKVVGGEPLKENTPLVIPMKPNTLITAERLKEIAEEVEKAVVEIPEPDVKIPSPEQKPENETLEQMAVRELIQEAKQEVKVETPMLTLPVQSNSVTSGEKESSIDDYEAVPIQEFGMAMLRGMGWTPSNQQSKYKQPQLRPKGLGLGADKVIKENQKKNESKDKNEELTIIKNAFVKITTGKYSSCYGKVVSLDEDNGRVMVEIPIKKETVSLSEFMMQPVTKSEFDKHSRIINTDKYEEYKKNEKTKSSKQVDSLKTDREGSSSHRSNSHSSRDNRKGKRENIERDKSNGTHNDKRKNRRDSSSSEERSQSKPEHKKYSSSDSLNSLSESDRKKHKENKKHYSSESDSSDSYKKQKRSKKNKKEAKRDIDKKRKGKKKKRDRDRSPNYKKYRK